MQYLIVYILTKGFPGCSASKESVCNAGVRGSVPGLGRSPGEGNGNPLPTPVSLPGEVEPMERSF